MKATPRTVLTPRDTLDIAPFDERSISGSSRDLDTKS